MLQEQLQYKSLIKMLSKSQNWVLLYNFNSKYNILVFLLDLLGGAVYP